MHLAISSNHLVTHSLTKQGKRRTASLWCRGFGWSAWEQNETKKRRYWPTKRWKCCFIFAHGTYCTYRGLRSGARAAGLCCCCGCVCGCCCCCWFSVRLGQNESVVAGCCQTGPVICCGAEGGFSPQSLPHGYIPPPSTPSSPTAQNLTLSGVSCKNEEHIGRSTCMLAFDEIKQNSFRYIFFIYRRTEFAVLSTS